MSSSSSSSSDSSSSEEMKKKKKKKKHKDGKKKDKGKSKKAKKKDKKNKKSKNTKQKDKKKGKRKHSSSSTEDDKKHKKKLDKEKDKQIEGQNAWVAKRMREIRTANPKIRPSAVMQQAQEDWANYNRDTKEAKYLKSVGLTTRDDALGGMDIEGDSWPEKAAKAGQLLADEMRTAAKVGNLLRQLTEIEETEIAKMAKEEEERILTVARENGLYKDDMTLLDKAKQYDGRFKQKTFTQGASVQGGSV